VVRLDRAFRADGEDALVAHDTVRREGFSGAGRNFLGALGFDLRIETICRAFCQASVVSEDEGGPMPHHIAEHLWDDRRPNGPAGQIAEVLDWHHNLEVKRFLVPRIHDGDGPRPAEVVLPTQETCGLFQRPDRG